MYIYDCFQWPYSEFVKIEPNIKAPGNNEFLITMKKGSKKTDTMKFSTDHRADILTETLVCAHYPKAQYNCLVIMLHLLLSRA